jgi:hypothetical protein
MNATIVSFGLSTNVWGSQFLACYIYNKVLHKKISKTSCKLFRKILSLSWNTSKCGGVWQIMLSEPKIRKLGYIIGYCDFIGFACNSSCYRFLVIKIYVLDYNI